MSGLAHSSTFLGATMADEQVFSCMQVVMHNIRPDDVSRNIVYSNNVSSDLLVLKFDRTFS